MRGICDLDIAWPARLSFIARTRGLGSMEGGNGRDSIAKAIYGHGNLISRWKKGHRVFELLLGSNIQFPHKVFLCMCFFGTFGLFPNHDSSVPCRAIPRTEVEFGDSPSGVMTVVACTRI